MSHLLVCPMHKEWPDEGKLRYCRIVTKSGIWQQWLQWLLLRNTFAIGAGYVSWFWHDMSLRFVILYEDLTVRTEVSSDCVCVVLAGWYVTVSTCIKTRFVSVSVWQKQNPLIFKLRRASVRSIRCRFNQISRYLGAYVHLSSAAALNQLDHIKILWVVI